MSTLSAWAARGAHRRDLDKNGTYEDDAAVTLMDAWYPKLVKAEFGPTLGSSAYDALTAVLKPQSVNPGDMPAAPDYDDTWVGYVSKDLRDIFNRKHVRGRWSRVYCGGGSKARCRTALRKSLSDALAVTKKDLYGRGDCADNAQASCFDMNRPTNASAVTMPAFPFQNRPTFQQTVELFQKLPR
jgi:hypothetical protein